MPAVTRQFQLIVSEDKMKVLVQGAPFSGEVESLAAELVAAMKDFNLKPLPEVSSVADMLNAAPHDENAYEKFVLLAGAEPVHPVDARLNWEGDFFSPGFAVDPRTGRIDYRRRAAQPEVQPDQLLAKLTPARPGIDGADVFGRRIHVNRPVRHAVRPGRNVRSEETEDGTLVFYAMISGRVRWDMKIISVDDVFRVAGDVNMESGNIKHNGAVCIEGDVKSGFSIEAEGDIEVRGTVEAANIRAGGNIMVSGGISSGRTTTSIQAKGSIHGKYILDARVEAGGDIVIEKEIVNAAVFAQGELNMPSGVIVGGEVVATRGIWASSTGSERGSDTSIAVGINPLLERKIEELTALKGDYAAEMEKIDQATTLRTDAVARLSPAQRQAFIDLLTRSAVCYEHVAQLSAEIEELKARAIEDIRPVIRVDNEVRAQTGLRIRNAVLLLHNTMIGPIRFYFGQGEVKFEIDRRET